MKNFESPALKTCPENPDSRNAENLKYLAPLYKRMCKWLTLAILRFPNGSDRAKYNLRACIAYLQNSSLIVHCHGIW